MELKRDEKLRDIETTVRPSDWSSTNGRQGLKTFQDEPGRQHGMNSTSRDARASHFEV